MEELIERQRKEIERLQEENNRLHEMLEKAGELADINRVLMASIRQALSGGVGQGADSPLRGKTGATPVAPTTSEYDKNK